ncbi:MAG TPA: AraC family transcriptional regulator [Segetibacter sp.]|jgi:AraC-like DNA-binding protein
MQHIEFIHKDHFEYRYFRKFATKTLSLYIDFCWETDFDSLLQEHPDGFTDVLFPNIGYTYIINLGTPFKMQLEQKIFDVKTDGFIPRHEYITAHHSVGNKLFGIKFKVCPIVFEKDIDFSEYKQHVYPLAYLIDRKVVEKIINAHTFQQRIDIVFQHYNALIDLHAGSLKYVTTVTEIIKKCIEKNEYDISIEKAAEDCKISKRTLQRYFEATTSFSSKQALQNLRIRKAVSHLTKSPVDFGYKSYGYYDYSHFCKHVKQFLSPHYYQIFQSFYGRKMIDGR